MPTGYTSKIYDGKPQTFKQFVLDCARAFGALIHMRDDSFDAPIPDEAPLSTYHRDQIVEYEKKLEQLKKMTPQEAQEEAQKECLEHNAQYDGYNKQSEERKKRYLNMLDKVNKWQPPTMEHVALKDFMIQQIGTSTEHDCHNYDDYKTTVNVDEWYRNKLQCTQDSLNYYREEWAKEQQRAKERTEWIRKLKESLE